MPSRRRIPQTRRKVPKRWVLTQALIGFVWQTRFAGYLLPDGPSRASKEKLSSSPSITSLSKVPVSRWLRFAPASLPTQGGDSARHWVRFAPGRHCNRGTKSWAPLGSFRAGSCRSRRDRVFADRAGIARRSVLAPPGASRVRGQDRDGKGRWRRFRLKTTQGDAHATGDSKIPFGGRHPNLGVLRRISRRFCSSREGAGVGVRPDLERTRLEIGLETGGAIGLPS